MRDEEGFLNAVRADQGAFLFMDHGNAGRRTGLDLIVGEKLAGCAVLFTGRAHFDADIQLKAVEVGIKILPKECAIGFQTFINFFVIK